MPHSQSAVHNLLNASGMPHSQGAVCDLLVDGEVHHEESALHDLHDGQRMPDSQSAVHGLQAGAIHSHGDSDSLRGTTSTGQAKLLRAANRLPASPCDGLHARVSDTLPDVHLRCAGLLVMREAITERQKRLLTKTKRAGLATSRPASF